MTDTKYRVQLAHGRIHVLTDGRKYKVHGIPFVNSADSMCGRADCGAVTSTAATLTHAPAKPFASRPARPGTALTTRPQPGQGDSPMATRSVVGILTNDGPRGVYVHSDGYPEHQLTQLRRIIERDGAAKAAHTIIEQGIPGGGWSYLDADQDGSTNRLGERAEPIVGYGLAYRDGQAFQPITLDELIADPFVPFAYFIDAETGAVAWCSSSDEWELQIDQPA